jgi:hypothetical protein
MAHIRPENTIDQKLQYKNVGGGLKDASDYTEM